MLPPIRHDAGKAAMKDRAFALFAAEEGDALGVFAQAHQAEAEIGLVALLVIAQPHQRMADQMRQQRAAGRVDDRREHQ